MIQKIVLLSLFSIFFIAGFANAICPVCTVAVGAGLGLSRWLGVDDLISGLWVGSLIISSVIWLLLWLGKKRQLNRWMSALVVLASYALVLVPLYFVGIMGHPDNQILGIDRLLAGTIIGSLVFLFSVRLHMFLRSKNQGKSFFPFQKVVVPLSLLILSSLIIYLLLWLI